MKEIKAKTKRQTKNGVTGVLLIIVLLICVILWPYISIAFSFILDMFGAAYLPPPKIEHGEFPFKLEYELNGEIVVVEDVLVCDYVGTYRLGVGGKISRRWESYIAGTGEKLLVLLEISKTPTSYQIIDYPMGSAGNYMGDGDNPQPKVFSEDAGFYEKSPNSTYAGVVSADELLKKYGIKIISWEIASPIKNEFGGYYPK